MLNSRVILSIVLAALIVVFLLLFSDIKKSAHLITGFNKIYILPILMLMLLYELLRGLLWQYLLKELNVILSLQVRWLSFFIGEITKNIPLGNYFPDYLLENSYNQSFGELSAATTLISIIEVFVCVCFVFVIGLKSWTFWLRIIIVGGSILAFFIVYTFHKLHKGSYLPKKFYSVPFFQNTIREVGDFKEGVRILLSASTIATMTGFIFTYIVIEGMVIYLLMLGLHIYTVSAFYAIAIYSFSLACSLILPLPTDVGILEISGAGAAYAVGLTRTQAIVLVLTNRVALVIPMLVITIIFSIIWHKETRELFRRL